jgi:hypothetical protein
MPALAFVAAVRTLIASRAISAVPALHGAATIVELAGHGIEIDDSGLLCARCGATLRAVVARLRWSEVEPWVRRHAPRGEDGEGGCGV